MELGIPPPPPKHTTAPLIIGVSAVLLIAFVAFISFNRAPVGQATASSDDTRISVIPVPAEEVTVTVSESTPEPIPTLEPAEPSVSEPPSVVLDDGTVEIIAFTDFQCPFSAQFHRETYPQLMETYGDTIRFTTKHLPSPLHPDAYRAAIAYECANLQGKAAAYADLLYRNQDRLSAESLQRYAARLDLNTAQFRECLSAEAPAPKVDADRAEAAKLRLDGTPIFFIDGVKLIGAQPFGEFQTLIEQKR